MITLLRFIFISYNYVNPACAPQYGICAIDEINVLDYMKKIWFLSQTRTLENVNILRSKFCNWVRGDIFKK